MKKKLTGIGVVLILGFTLAFAACAPAVSPPAAQPDQKALHFYEFYSPM